MPPYHRISVRTFLQVALYVGWLVLPNLLAAQLAARDTLSRIVGSRVRLQSESHGQRVGTLLDARHDSLFLYACGHCTPFRFAEGDVTRVDVSRGWSERRVYRDFVLAF